MAFPRRVSLAIARTRDGELIALGLSEKPSELLPLLDQVDPAEIECAALLKDVILSPTQKRTYPLEAPKEE